MTELARIPKLPAHLVDPETGEALALGPAAMLSIFDPNVVAEAIFAAPAPQVAALLRLYMDWETEVGRHLKRVMSDALYANLLDKAAKMTVRVQVGDQELEVKGEKASTAESAETWDCSVVYDTCVDLVEEGHLLPVVLDEFKLEQKVEITCTATTVKNLREHTGPVADAIEALVSKVPRARKAVSVSWK